MDAEKQTTTAAPPSLERLICSSFPPLDPNGQPFSMILRGTAAELGELRSALSASDSNARQQLQVELEMNEKDDVDKFGDVGVVEPTETQQSDGFQGGNETNSHQAAGSEYTGDGTYDETENKKRSRGDDDGDDNDIDDEEECDENIEQLIVYLPSIQCTCSSWNMKNVSGDMFVTSLRVLFLSERQADGEQCDDDVAVDGRCIALHAVDSLPSTEGDENQTDISHHVYCQLSEPMGDGGDMGYTSAISMMSPTKIAEEYDDKFNDDGNDEGEEDEDASSEEDGTVEVYFKPTISDEGGKDGSESQSNKCQTIFDSLTKLASLNPAGDSDDGMNGGGGLFSMLSLMAGIGNASNGFDGEMVVANHDDDDSDDDMVVRLGGSNNLVENDDESEGAAENDRQAMLRRLDDMLVVPPEYEIASGDLDGQFDDAEDEEGDDEIL
mmetsp:Transcript_22439/g.48658  ORF Transcript_22439/g.48658 Transcript_22439/m.48658 type:complete len:440 (-) Transcript_22439:173-1492(-)